jgi:hypothetical protein
MFLKSNASSTVASMRFWGWTLIAAMSLGGPMSALGQYPCPGDCNGDGQVTVDELAVGVGIILGQSRITECFAFNIGRDGSVDVTELTLGITFAHRGCLLPAESAALFGVYDVTGRFKYDGALGRPREAVAIIDAGRGTAAHLDIEFDHLTRVSLDVRMTDAHTLRFDGTDVEQGDLLQFMSGSARLLLASELVSIRGSIDSLLGPPFPTLSHGIEIEMNRSPASDATPFGGLYRFTFDEASAMQQALISIEFAKNGVGRCSAGNIVDSAGATILHLDEADCYLSSTGRLFYDGGLLRMRGAIEANGAAILGSGTFAVGFGIGTSRVGAWTATRASDLGT